MGCEVIIALLGNPPFEISELQLAADIAAKSMRNGQIERVDGYGFTDFVISILNEHPELRALRIDDQVYIRKERR